MASELTEEIESLDKEIEEGKKTLALIERTHANAADDKVYKILNAKVKDWIVKRDLLLNQFVLRQVRKK